MKKGILFLVMALASIQMHALHIREIIVTRHSPNAINVAINTEAVELYYFHSARYTILENTITIEACYVAGFGSTIAFLNNNIVIPVHTERGANYRLTVKIYYTDQRVFYEEQNLQDEVSGLFYIPFSGQLILQDNSSEMMVLFPNPVESFLTFSKPVRTISIYDTTGRIITGCTTMLSNYIDLSNLKTGIYFVEYIEHQQVHRKKIVKQ